VSTFVQCISNHYLIHYLILDLFHYIVYRTLAAFVIQKCFNQYNSRKLEVLREEFSENGKMRCFVLLVRDLIFIMSYLWEKYFVFLIHIIYSLTTTFPLQFLKCYSFPFDPPPSHPPSPSYFLLPSLNSSSLISLHPLSLTPFI
jgi:hypothetical protein